MLIIKPTIKCVYNSQSGISKLTCTHVCTKENLLFTPCNHFPVDATRVPSHKLEFAQHTIIIWKNARVRRTGAKEWECVWEVKQSSCTGGGKKHVLGVEEMGLCGWIGFLYLMCLSWPCGTTRCGTSQPTPPKVPPQPPRASASEGDFSLPGFLTSFKQHREVSHF